MMVGLFPPSLIPLRRLWRVCKFRLLGLGWPGMLGFGLLLGCAVVASVVLLPATRQLQQMERDVAQLRNGMSQHRGQWIDRSPQAALKAFYRVLPQESSAPEHISAIFNAADASGIDLDKVEYALVREHTAGLSRYQVILPVQGTYPDIRRFIIELLNTMPALAINELSFKREDVSSPEVEARVRLTIYLGRAS